MTNYVLYFTHSGYLTGLLKEMLEGWEKTNGVEVEKDPKSYGAWRLSFQTEDEARHAYTAVRKRPNILGMTLVCETVLIHE